MHHICIEAAPPRVCHAADFQRRCKTSARPSSMCRPTRSARSTPSPRSVAAAISTASECHLNGWLLCCGRQMHASPMRRRLARTASPWSSCTPRHAPIWRMHPSHQQDCGGVLIELEEV